MARHRSQPLSDDEREKEQHETLQYVFRKLEEHGYPRRVAQLIALVYDARSGVEEVIRKQKRATTDRIKALQALLAREEKNHQALHLLFGKGVHRFPYTVIDPRPKPHKGVRVYTDEWQETKCPGLTTCNSNHTLETHAEFCLTLVRGIEALAERPPSALAHQLQDRPELMAILATKGSILHMMHGELGLSHKQIAIFMLNSNSKARKPFTEEAVENAIGAIREAYSAPKRQARKRGPQISDV